MLPLLSIQGDSIASGWTPLEHAIFFGFILIAFFWAWCVFWANIRAQKPTHPAELATPSTTALVVIERPVRPYVATVEPRALPEAKR